MEMTIPNNGELWRHYKGGVYEILSVAQHTETEEWLVVYQSMGYTVPHIRPLLMWNETVADRKGALMPRFQLVHKVSPTMKCHRVHYHLAAFYDAKDYDSALEYLTHLHEYSKDINELRSALLISKSFKNHEILANILSEIADTWEVITGKPLV
jgi:hypothetical protein